MKKYKTTLVEVPSTDFEQSFLFGTTELKVRFVWDSDMQEEYEKLTRAVNTLRDADPLIDTDGSILRDYDYIEYYTSTVPSTPSRILELLKANELAYPQSLRSLTNELKVLQLYQKQEECKEIASVVDVYAQNQFWKVVVTTVEGDVWTGEVQPGGWINEQGLEWKLQFVSDLESIGRDDLLKVTIYAEVADV